MERTIKIQTEVSEEKFRLVDEYEGIGIYQKVTPNGYYLSQTFGFKVGNNFYVSYSFMNNDKEDIFDYIDNYNNTGVFGFKCFNKGSYYCLHRNGNIYL